jgi:hypothetical protein
VVKPSQASEEFAVRDDAATKIGQFTYFRKIEGKLAEDFRIEAESPIEVPISRCRFAGVRLLAIDKENLPGSGCMLGTSIRVLLNAFFDDADHEMVVRVTSESVFHIKRMNSLYGIRTLETINANPLRGLRHMRPEAPQTTLFLRMLMVRRL